jgi:hypothetical protein
MGYLDADEELTGNVIADHWHGRHSLPRAYWINGMLIAGVGGALILIAIDALAASDLSLQVAAAIALAGAILGVAIWIWSVVGIWRSADRHGERGGREAWAGVAKALVVLGAFGMAGQLTTAAPGYVETARLAANDDPIGLPAEVGFDGDTITLVGPIAQGTAARLRATLSAHPGATRLKLSSEGGRMRDAQQIAQVVRKHGMDTEVVGSCESACTLIVLAGKGRFAAIGSRVGFHQPSFPGTQPSEQAQMVEDLKADYSKAGLPGRFVRKALSEPPESMWYPDEPELFGAGVLNAVSRERVVQDNRVSAAEVNAKTPIQLDEVTTLISATAQEEQLTFRYRIEAYQDEIDRASFVTTMTRANKAGICAQPLVPFLITAGATYRYVYRDIEGTTFADFVVKSCE